MATKYVFSVTLPYAVDPDPVTSEQPRATINRVADMFDRIAGHRVPGDVTVVCDTSAVAASSTVTAAAVQAADTVTVGGVVFTAVTGAVVGDQFDRSGTDTACAVSLVAAITANATLAGAVVATSALGVVTITASTPGKVGNAITLASSNGTRLAVSAARLASGAQTRTTLSY